MRRTFTAKEKASVFELWKYGKTVLKSQTVDGLYYAVRYLSCMASAMVQPEQEASPLW